MESRSPEIIGVMALFMVLAWIAVLLRCWVRIMIIKSFATDDWLTVISLLLFTVYGVFVFVGSSWGTGRHLADLTFKQIQIGMKTFYFGELFYILSTTLLRLAVGYFILRLTEERKYRIIVHTLNVVNVVFNTYFFIMSAVQCTPASNFWTTVRTVHCIDTRINVISTYVQSGICALIDWVFALLPISFLWRLDMSIRKKILVGLILSVGGLASTAPLARIPSVVTLSQTQDFLWVTSEVVIWSSVEPGLGLTVISLATLKPFFRKSASTKSASNTWVSNEFRFNKNGQGAQQPDDTLELNTTGSNKNYGNSSVVRAGEVNKTSYSTEETDRQHGWDGHGDRSLDFVKAMEVKSEPC